MAQTPIRAIDVARPNRRSHSLLAEESGSRQEKDPLPVRRRFPVLLDSESMREREYIRVLGSVANRNLLVLENGVAPMRLPPLEVIGGYSVIGGGPKMLDEERVVSYTLANSQLIGQLDRLNDDPCF